MTTGRHGQEDGSGGRGGVGRRHKTMDAHLTTLCSSLSEDTLINPCHNILLFCHFSRRGESSRAESSRVENFLLLLLLLQTHHLFWIYSAIIQNTFADWHTGKRTHGQLSGQTNEQEISLLLTHPDIPPGLVWQAQLSTDYSCAYTPPPAPWAMIKVLSARRAAYAAFPAASLPASSQAARLIRPLSANSAFLLIATLHSRLPR